MKVSLDHMAMVALLQGPIGRQAADSAADDIASGLGDVVMHDGTPHIAVEHHDARLSAAASVTLVHPGAGAAEAKHAYLAKATRAAGYKLKAR